MSITSTELTMIYRFIVLPSYLMMMVGLLAWHALIVQASLYDAVRRVHTRLVPRLLLAIYPPLLILYILDTQIFRRLPIHITFGDDSALIQSSVAILLLANTILLMWSRAHSIWKYLLLVSITTVIVSAMPVSLLIIFEQVISGGRLCLGMSCPLTPESLDLIYKASALWGLFL